MKTLSLTLAASALALVATMAGAEPIVLAQQSATSAMQAGSAPEGNTTAVSPEERAKLKAEKAAKRDAASKVTPEQKAAAKQTQKAERKAEAKKGQPFVTEGNTTTVSTQDRAQLRSERATKKAADAQMTPAQKKARAAEMQKESDKLEKSYGGGN